MCGIAGYLGGHGAPDRGPIAKMTAALTSRGPDDDGHFAAGPVVLGHRRLRIVDLEGGRQPMSTPDGRLTIVFNGEIYNHLALRNELEGRGRAFTTRSDTEAILHAYAEWGAAAVERLNGMFAFAIWDAQERRLFLARDRAGEKPLYYAQTRGAFVFASEAKSILAGGWLAPRVDLAALRKYLAYEYVPAPDSIYAGIRKLPPASTLTVAGDTATLARYWQPRFAPDRRRSEDVAADELFARLRRSVEMRLMSDVPLGVFLSGGIDSAAVTAAMAECMPPSRIRTFAIGFASRSFDEAPFAEETARHLGTDHTTIRLEGAALADALPAVAAYFDEPFADPSALPTYLLARETRKHVTVALGGDGGDELFAGYPTFRADAAAEVFGRLPRAARRAVEALAARLPTSFDYLSLDFKAKQFLRGAAFAPAERHQRWLASFTPEEQRELLTAEVLAAAPGDPFAGASRWTGAAEHPLDRLAVQYLETYLADDILVKVDRATMAVSLESRAPFLDHEFIEFAFTIPAAQRRQKRILKRALRGKVPDAALRRPKRGFALPVADMLNREWRDLTDELLAPAKLKAQGLFAPAYVARLLGEHRARRRDNRKPLWTLLMFQLWYSTYSVTR